jgi:DNA-binding transcriptional ArsR family regulator
MQDTFEVLALPARREIIDALRLSPHSVGQLVEKLDTTQPMVSKQLKVLRDSGFVSVRADAQRRLYELRPERFREMAQWLQPYRQMWESHLDLLGQQLDAMRDEEERP